MRTLPLALAVALAGATLLACPASRDAVVVEESSPIVGPDGRTTQALGIASQYGEFMDAIPAGTQVPCSSARPITSSRRRPDRIEFAVFRGNASDTRDAHPLGQYWAPKPGKRARIVVTFAIDADRRITLTAKDEAGKAVKLSRDP